MSIVTRKDVRWVCIAAPTENDGGISYLIGHDAVTEIHIVPRHGPMDWIPYIVVYKGDRLFAEIPQHSTLCVEFLPDPSLARSAA